MTIFWILNSELRSIIHSVPGRNELRVYCKALFSSTSCLMHLQMTNSFLVEETEVCNYADDITIYVYGHELEHIVSNLETDAPKLSK